MICLLSMPMRARRRWTTPRVMGCGWRGRLRCWTKSVHRSCAHRRTLCHRAPRGKAASYTLALWNKLTRFLEYPELELSNNLAENSMRPIAIGRKNWIHIGSTQAGPKVAAIFSVIESCRRMKIPVREYLAAVLPGLNNLSIHRVAELTPKAWAAKHNQPAS